MKRRSKLQRGTLNGIVSYRGRVKLTKGDEVGVYIWAHWALRARVESLWAVLPS